MVLSMTLNLIPQARVDDHLMGKQHMGYARMRAKIAQLKDFIDKKRDSRRGSRRMSEERNNGQFLSTTFIKNQPDKNVSEKEGEDEKPSKSRR